jgi:hypothetical protein
VAGKRRLIHLPDGVQLPLKFFPALVLLLALVASCGGGGKDVPASDVVSALPWKSGESAVYVLKNKKGETVGKTTLSVSTSGSNVELVQDFANDTATDVSTVVADSTTLKPVSATRKIKNPKDTRELVTTYSKDGALIKDGDKQSGISVPEHAYDNDASLVIWRTLAFAEGYQAKYITIITNQRTKQEVTLKVTRKETVRVPAGEFTAWRLEIAADEANQVAWIADTPSRPLVRYDNDHGLIFELEKAP